MKNLLVLMTKIAIMLILVFSLTTCDILLGLMKDNVKEPEVTFESVELVGINWNGVELLCTVNVENPNTFLIPFPDTNWILHLDNKHFLTINIEKDKVDDTQTVKKQAGYENLVIKAGESVPIKFYVNFSFLKIFETIKSLIGKDSVGYKIELEILIPIDKLDTVIPIKIEKEGEIEMLKAPTLNLPTASLGNIHSISGFPPSGKIDLNTSFNFVNPNSFSLPAPQINIDYKIGNTSLIANKKMPQEELKSSTTTVINNIFEVDVVGTLYTLLTEGNSSQVLTYSYNFMDIPITGFSIPATPIIIK